MWTIELVRGPLDNRKYTHTSRDNASRHAMILVDLHHVKSEHIHVDIEAKEILIDATDWYTK